MGKAFLLLLVGMPAVAPAASFTLGAVLRAGDVFSDNMRLGPSASSPAAAGGLFPFLIDGADHAFQLSYDAATNVASVSINWLGIFTTGINWAVAGGSTPTAARQWTIAAGSLALTALNDPANPSSVRIQNLSIGGPGMAVINPPSLIASQNGTGTGSASNAATILFTTPNGQGSWVLNGQVRFTGLLGINRATDDDLRVAFDLVSSDAPEPASLLISALGFAALGVLYHFRARRRASRTGATPMAAAASKASPATPGPLQSASPGPAA